MKRVFLGVFLIACGLLFVASNLDLLTIDLSMLRKFWPLLFILWGISLLFENQKIRTVIKVICAVLVAGVVFAFCDGARNGIRSVTKWHSDLDSSKVETMSELYDSTMQEAELNFSGGAGEFSLKDTTDLLVDLTHYGSNSYAKIKSTKEASKQIINVNVDRFDRIIRNHTLSERVKIKLNPHPIWDINYSVGAADTELDFSGFKTRNIVIDAGAASIDLKLGSRFAKTAVEISAGASSVTIRVPKDAYCFVKSESALSSIDTGEGLVETSDNNYQTDNKAAAKSEIEVSIDAGVSSVEIERY